MLYFRSKYDFGGLIMPVGPSHHRGGGFRSSSSRSSRSRSSYRSSSSGRSYHSHTYWGGSVEISPRAAAIIGIIIGFIVAISGLVASVTAIANNWSYRILMRKDAQEYQEIIDRAHAGEDGYYIITYDNIMISGSSTVGEHPTEYQLTNNYNGFYATAYSEVTKNGVNYYYLVVAFDALDGTRITGTTYTYYSEAAVAGLSSITLVYTKEYDGDGSYDIIQENYSLDKNIDYWHTGKCVGLGFGGVAESLGLGLLMIWCCKRLKKSKKTSNEMPEDIKEKWENMVAEGKDGTIQACVYCGSTYDLSVRKCESCGSKEFKVIKDK